MDTARHIFTLRTATVLLCAAAALGLLSIYGGDVPEDRVLEPLALTGARLVCQRSYDAMPLRVMIQHCPDGTPWQRFCYHECGYEAITL